jgi:hypothetical protein
MSLKEEVYGKVSRGDHCLCIPGVGSVPVRVPPYMSLFTSNIITFNIPVDRHQLDCPSKHN